MARGQFISVRVTEDEKRNLAALAAEQGISLSDWIRQAVFAYELDKRVVGGLLEAVMATCNADSYKQTRGVIPWKEGDELPEAAIRRLRDGG